MLESFPLSFLLTLINGAPDEPDVLAVGRQDLDPVIPGVGHEQLALVPGVHGKAARVLELAGAGTN